MSKDTTRKIIAYWQHKYSTAEIAGLLHVPEADVYNVLARWRS